MKGAAYAPAQGDVVWLDFNPQAGREQAGRRPAVVLSPREYNKRSGLQSKSGLRAGVTDRSVAVLRRLVIAATFLVSDAVLGAIDASGRDG